MSGRIHRFSSQLSDGRRKLEITEPNQEVNSERMWFLTLSFKHADMLVLRSESLIMF